MPRRSDDDKTSSNRRRSEGTRTATSRRSLQKNSETKRPISKPTSKEKVTTASNKPKLSFEEKYLGKSEANKRPARTKKPIEEKRISHKKHSKSLWKSKPTLKKDETKPLRSLIDKTSELDARSKNRKHKVDAEMRKSFIKLIVMVAVGIGVIVSIYFGVQSILAKQSGFVDIEKTEPPSAISTQVPRDRNKANNTAEGESTITPNPAVVRDISYGARDIQFKERHINIPGIYDNELLFSAGSGSLYVGSNVLKKLYLYNLDSGDETLIAESAIDGGVFYETLVNHNWLVWLETDRGTKNYIMTMNRATGDISKIQSFKESQPKLQMYGDLLVWMEQVSPTEDRLSMSDLNNQEYLPIFTFTDKATYGVSSPCVYEDTIVWAGPDPTQSDEDKLVEEHSAVYYLELVADETGALGDAEYFSPNTYVHEPLFNGDVFVWLDGNKSPNSNLYVGRPDEEAKLIANGVTTYSVGDGIVVYGKDQAVWVYITATDELCRLTSPNEKGMLPAVTKRTVVWYNLSVESDKNVLRFKVLTDDELYPGGMD